MQQSRFGKLAVALTMAGMLTAQSALLAAAPEKAAPKVFLGIAATATTPDGAATGVVVHQLAPDGPASKAGLKNGDRIVKIGDHEVKSFADLQNVLKGHKAGDELTFHVMREDKAASFHVKLGTWPEHKAAPAKPAAAPQAYLGVHTQPMADEEGAVITHVMPESPAAKAGLKEKDVITRVGTSTVADPQELRDLILKKGAGQETTLTVIRGNDTKEIKVHLSEAPVEATAGPHALPGVPEALVNPMQFWPSLDKAQTLEKKIEQLENRVRELEQKLAK